MTKSKILIIVPGMYGGGTAQVLLNLLKHNKLENNEFNIDILILYKGGELDYRLKEPVFDSYHFSYATNNRIILKLLNLASKYKVTARILSSIIIKKNYDVGICYQESRWSTLIAYSKKINKKVTWFHSVITTNPGFYNIVNNKKSLKRYKTKHKEFDYRVFVSNASKQAFEQLTGILNNNTIIHNIIDYSKITELAGENNNIPGKTDYQGLKIIMVGNLIEVKGYPFALKVFKSLKQKGINFCVNILGSGENYKELMNQITNYDLTAHVFLLGFVRNPFIFIEQSDLYFSSSISEARPTAVIEALCLKKPYVVPSIPAYEEIHQQYNAGLLYKPSSFEDAASAIIQLNNDKELRNKFTKGLEEIKWEEVGNEYVEIFLP